MILPLNLKSQILIPLLLLIYGLSFSQSDVSRLPIELKTKTSTTEHKTLSTFFDNYQLVQLSDTRQLRSFTPGEWFSVNIGDKSLDLNLFHNNLSHTIEELNHLSFLSGTVRGGGQVSICLLYTSPSPRDRG